jgi:hypothetical protein
MPNLGNTTRPAYVYDAETDTWCPIGVGAHTHDQIPASIVDAKGDLIVGTAADTVQRRSVGADGSYLIADSTQTTGLNWAGPSNIAGKNLVINGGFDIWQRGTSLTPAVTTFTSYQADRWSTYSAANWTVSRQLTNDTTNLPNIQYCGRFQRNVGNTATTICQIQNVFETANSIPLAGKTVTLSYYARRGADYSAVGNSFTVSIYIGTSTDAGIGSFTSASVAGGVAGALTTTWQRFTVTAAIPSTVTQIAIYTTYNPTGTAGANDYFEITGVQLETGSTATPFSRAGGNIQAELAACQRYYYRATGSAVNALVSDCGISYSSTKSNIIVKFPVQMRTTPSAVDYTALIVSDLVNYNFNVSNMTIEPNNSNQNIVLLDTTSATGTIANRSAWVRAAGAGGYLGLSAEL